ncbi:tyrosine-type recombinase/integrase [Pontibacillus yanchengensis]|uniref:Tyrosine-type recombinase/integrase n=1 Tax=Pontibacillus yanchengensis TaxID=462910 RepID=A0ACC7VF28_9BACI|nr:site-specific integrase [Pontibacillus yanchengensis]MYL53302.1 tyrosine-type recombinase/integrase [Pontibacillus yanchengensis]
MADKEKNVQPLRTSAEIDEMKWALRRFCSERDRFLFSFGINTGLRVSDIVPLTVGDVRNKTHVIKREKKTGKARRFYLNQALRADIDAYISGLDDAEYLFPSRKGNAHISTTQAYRTLVKAAEMLGRDDVGSHTMRKSFGYHYYKRTKDVAALQTLFNHSAPSITLKYIGITDEEIEASLEDFSL